MNSKNVTNSIGVIKVSSACSTFFVSEDKDADDNCWERSDSDDMQFTVLLQQGLSTEAFVDTVLHELAEIFCEINGVYFISSNHAADVDEIFVLPHGVWQNMWSAISRSIYDVIKLHARYESFCRGAK